MKKIAWITSAPFIDTDIYIIPELSKYYHIDWYITKKSIENLDYDLRLFTSSNPDVSVKVINLSSRDRNIKNISIYFRTLWKIRKKHYDLIYVVHANFPYFMPLVRLILGKEKTVVAMHNVTIPKGGSNEKLMRMYNRFVLNSFSLFHVFSKSQYDAITSITKGKKVLFAPFLLKDYGEATHSRNDTRITLMNFGNIREYKRIDVLIDAAEMAYKETRIMFRVIIAGRCTNWDKYQTHIHNNALFDIRIERVDNKDIPELFEECDYFVAPYQGIAQSGSLIVAINYGKPIIASDLEAFREYIVDGENGFMIKPADVQDLKKVIINILKHHNEKYDEMCKNQQRIKSTKFSSSIIAEKYRSYFDEICNE